MYGLSLTTKELQYLKINLEDRKESLDDNINNEQIPKDVFNELSKINSNILEKIAILLNSKERIISQDDINLTIDILKACKYHGDEKMENNIKYLLKVLENE